MMYHLLTSAVFQGLLEGSGYVRLLPANGAANYFIHAHVRADIHIPYGDTYTFAFTYTYTGTHPYAIEDLGLMQRA